MARKILRITSIIILSIFVAIVLFATFYWLKIEYGIKITEFQSFDKSQLYVWNKVTLDDPCTCADGSDFWIYTKKGKSKNLIIHFQGGGGCWDDSSCTEPLNWMNPDGFYFQNISEWSFKAFFSSGIFENSDRNPFKDWNVIYIPYCTGDLHIGNADNEYIDTKGNTKLVRHAGRVNITKALDWVKINIKDAEGVFISGESAGGFGSIFWTPYIVDIYPGSIFYQISDCSFLNSEVMVDAVHLWQAETENIFGFTVNSDLVNSALHYSANTIKGEDIQFLQSYSKYDEILVRFEAEINNHSTDNNDYIIKWSNEMLKAIQQNTDSIDNYFYYVTDWNQRKNGKTPHVFINSTRFFECIEDGIIFRDWIERSIIEDQPYSVGKLE